ncbi:MAG: glycosyltransferase, partial [Ekhidna sp.]|nr:glycosyltransferase [Ekhidna sp.]
MTIFIIIVTGLHVLAYMYLIKGWMGIGGVQSKKPKNCFSVVVPVRNEEKNIVDLLSDLGDQSYPSSHFEIIVVNDFSEDRTVDVVNEIQNELSISVKLINLDNKDKTGKKHALTAGIGIAKYDHIITTDADCRLGRNWLDAYNKAFDEHVNMVTGPVAIRKDHFFAGLQQVEFAGLIGLGAITLSKENPTTSSGANLG